MNGSRAALVHRVSPPPAPLRLAHLRRQLGDGLVQQGMALARGNFLERQQDKVPHVHFNVRNDEIIVVHHKVIVQQDIKIQRPRPPVDEALAVRRLLDIMQTIEQLVRRQEGLELQASAAS